MFGYLKPHEPYLYKKDDVLYKALYCGICKSLGSTCGQMARMSLTYDIAFLSAFAHNVRGEDVTIEKRTCVAHPFKKGPVIKRDLLSDRLSYVNVILLGYKLADDDIDGKKRTLKSALFKGRFDKAKRKFPLIDEIVKSGYERLRRLENADSGLIDAVSEEFGNMLKAISDAVLEEYKTEYTGNLFYYVGKWIYVLDAIDDYDKDKKRGEYNPFSARYGEETAKEIIEKHTEDIDFMFSDIFRNIRENHLKINYRFNRDLIENVLLRGIHAATTKVLNSKLTDKKEKGKIL